MDAAPHVAAELCATSRWSGNASPHELAEALSLILPLLPLDARARAACVNPAWRAATAHPALWEELSFARCTARVDDATLAALCARAGAALRTLSVESGACARVTTNGTLGALRGGRCTGLRRLSTPPNYLGALACKMLSVKQVQQLAAACPRLTFTACEVRCMTSDAAAAVAALPGPLLLNCSGYHNVESATQLAECLRVNTTFTSLDLRWNDIGAAGATQLAECLRVNATLTRLRLGRNNIGTVGATQLAQCLRVNATMTRLSLDSNNIGDTGATQLAECLRVNTTLTSLNLGRNNIGDAGATQLAECLRLNATLTSLALLVNRIGEAGATQLAECLRVNAALTSLDLSWNHIGDAGATQLAECLRINTTLTSLDLSSNDIGDADVFRAAFPPQCTLTM